MRISELSATTGVPVATIKYYLREGLLPAGVSRARTQADYGDDHVRRLHLIRTLIEVAGLAIADIRAVAAAVDDETISLHNAFGVAHDAITPRHGLGAPEERATAARQVDDLIDALGWQVRPEAQSRQMLADALVILTRAGIEPDLDHTLASARAAHEQARNDLTSVPVEIPRSEAVEYVVIGTLAGEVAANALRRLAQEHESSLRFGSPDQHSHSGGAGASGEAE